MSSKEELTPQEQFNMDYITCNEIQKMLEVKRSVILHARLRGILPGAIRVPGGPYIWKRQTILPYLNAWYLTLKARRKQLNAD